MCPAPEKGAGRPLGAICLDAILRATFHHRLDSSKKRSSWLSRGDQTVGPILTEDPRPRACELPVGQVPPDSPSREVFFRGASHWIERHSPSQSRSRNRRYRSPRPGLNEEMPGTGVEPARLAAPDPKSGASANSAIPAAGKRISIGERAASTRFGGRFIGIHTSITAP